MNTARMSLDRINISDQRAKEIAEALTEADRLAKLAINLEIEQYKNALQELQEKRNRLLDFKLDGSVNSDDYKHKVKQIDDDMKHYMKLQEDAQYRISDAWKVTADLVLELAKDAKELWKAGSLAEKLEILKRVCWNPILDGANLRYGLRKPFATLAEMSENQDWRPLVVHFRIALQFEDVKQALY